MASVAGASARQPAGRSRSAGRRRGVLITADRVVTLGHGRYRARALVVRGSRVVWVGDDPETAPPHGSRAGPGRLRGRAGVRRCPRPHDPHRDSRSSVSTSPRSGRGGELLLAIDTYAGQHTGRVIWGHGYDPYDFPDDLPTPDDLSHASGGRPVTLSRRDGHSSLVDRHDAAGRPTGPCRRRGS